MITNALLGHRIKTARLLRNISQAELGNMLDPTRSHSAISLMEKGTSRVFVTDLVRIAEVTQLSFKDYFLDNVGDKG